MAALQPSDRFAGSQHVLVFEGTLERDTANAATYPKAQASYPSDAAAGAKTPFRFLLADTTDLTNLEKQLPHGVFDDGQPAGAAPHDYVLGGATQGLLTATDKNISARTWAQNAQIRITPTTEAAADVIATVDYSSARWCLDVGASSGLGTDTGFPVLVIGIFYQTGSNPGATLAGLHVRIEITHSTVR
jgi:hypothetical protein